MSLYLRQLLSGRDHARTSPAAEQMANFAYLVGCTESKQCVAVDPTWDPRGIARLAAEDGMELVGIVATHGHPDHVGGHWMGMTVPGVAELHELVEQPVIVHADEVDMVKVLTGLTDSALTLEREGDVLEVGRLRIDVLHTPGHSPGSMSLLFAGHVITGDVLFVGACGRVDLPGADVRDMRASLRRLSQLPGETVVLPGHDYGPAPTSTIAHENRTNPFMDG